MIGCIIYFKSVSLDAQMRTKSYREKNVDLKGKISGAERVYDTLYFDEDYEEEFDEYWTMADARIAFVRGRFADDKTPYINEITEFKNTTTNEEWRKEAEKYLEKLQ